MIDYVQVYARSVEKCFTREATAIDSCPTDREVFYLEIEDFLLYSKYTVKKTLLRFRIYIVVIISLIRVNVCLEICVSSGRKSVKRLL